MIDASQITLYVMLYSYGRGGGGGHINPKADKSYSLERQIPNFERNPWCFYF